jgi:peptide/nickel transport system permease protein
VRRIAKHVGIVVLTVTLGGLLSATLVRFAPGFGVDEEELDVRLSASSMATRRGANQQGSNILRFYGSYLVGMLHGNLGFSRTLQRPISQLLKERAPETIKDVFTGWVVSWFIGFTLAATIVLSRYWLLDGFATITSSLLLSLPAAVLGLVFAFTRAPAGIAIGLVLLPKVLRYSRNLLVHSSGLPHVVTARAKGLSDSRVFVWHVLINTAPQLLSVAGVTVSIALTAAIPIEALCDLPGIGQLAWKAALGRDLPLLVNLTVVVTSVTLLANSAADVLGHVLAGERL